VAEGARLESVYTARYPGFESLSLRHRLFRRRPAVSYLPSYLGFPRDGMVRFIDGQLRYPSTQTLRVTS
jgi:hypothetical protein